MGGCHLAIYHIIYVPILYLDLLLRYKKFLMLHFHSKIVEELQNEDGLLIIAGGLGIDIIIRDFIFKLQLDKFSLVFVLNDQNPTITNDTNLKNREKIYALGGVHSVTSRILVTDLINNCIDFANIKGILVLEADKVTEKSTEHFILKLIHQHTKPFVKGFSENPVKFVFGYNKVERMLSNLFMSNLILYPRYREDINNDIKKLVVEEHCIPVHPDLLDIEHSIRDCLELVVRDLRNSCKWIDATEITLEKCLTSNFEYLLRQELEPNNYKLSDAAQLAIEEIKFFKRLFHYLYDYDCVSFLKYFEMHIAAMKIKAPWTTHFAASQIHTKAKDRVYLKKECPAIYFKHDLTTYKLPANVIPVLKDNCKWSAIRDIISDKTLILTDSLRTTLYLRKYLAQPSVEVGNKSFNLLLLHKMAQYFKTKGQLEKNNIVQRDVAVEKPKSKRRRIRGNQIVVNNLQNQIIEQDMDMDLVDLEEELGNIPNNAIIENVNDVNSVSALNKLKPKEIILYHPNLYALRMVEVYATLNEVKIHILTIKESQEELEFLSDLRREKDSFHRLIIDKERLAVPIQTAFVSDQNATTRIAGGQVTEKSTIIDVREFRSKLPLSLFNRHFKLSAVTLSVGDYVLAPNMAVERKVVSDLISSLSSGRLYFQAQQLTLNYEIPILLIEFTESRSLKMQYLMKYNSLGKLTVLLNYFPKLLVFFSPTTEFTAELFDMLKRNKKEPDIEEAKAIGSDEDSLVNGADFIKSLPGINSFNYKKLIKEYHTVAEVLQAPKNKLKTIIGKQNGEDLYEFINKEFVD